MTTAMTAQSPSDADATLELIVAINRMAVQKRLTEVQAELDEIGTTFGLNAERARLRREKDDLLDQLLGLRAIAA